VGVLDKLGVGVLAGAVLAVLGVGVGVGVVVEEPLKTILGLLLLVSVTAKLLVVS
jgi:hypothetical protein